MKSDKSLYTCNNLRLISYAHCKLTDFLHEEYKVFDCIFVALD